MESYKMCTGSNSLGVDVTERLQELLSWLNGGLSKWTKDNHSKINCDTCRWVFLDA